MKSETYAARSARSERRQQLACAPCQRVIRAERWFQVRHGLIERGARFGCGRADGYRVTRNVAR